jgi:hypothetical protein
MLRFAVPDAGGVVCVARASCWWDRMVHFFQIHYLEPMGSVAIRILIWSLCCLKRRCWIKAAHWRNVGTEECEAPAPQFSRRAALAVLAGVSGDFGILTDRKQNYSVNAVTEGKQINLTVEQVKVRITLTILQHILPILQHHLRILLEGKVCCMLFRNLLPTFVHHICSFFG